VAEGEDRDSRPFHVRTIHYLARLMRRFDLAEINLREGEHWIRLRRANEPMAKAASPVAIEAAQMSAVAPASATPPTAAPPSAVPSGKPTHEIKSPTPGTFYAASSPEAQPYAKVGSKVKPETVVCLIEAMKVFNEINAECTGTIVAIMAENQQPVEYGQVLFKVELD